MKIVLLRASYAGICAQQKCLIFVQNGEKAEVVKKELRAG